MSATKKVGKLAQETKLKVKNTEKQPSASRTQPGRNARPVSLIYVPLFLGGSHRGASMGPAAMRVAELPERIKSLGFKVADEIDIDVPNSVCWWDKDSQSKCVPEIHQVSEAVADAAQQEARLGQIVLAAWSSSRGIVAVEDVNKRGQGDSLVWLVT